VRLQAADIDWSELDDDERATLEQVIPRIEEGYDVKQIAAELGIDAKQLQASVDRLAAKIMALSGSIELPPLSEEEYEALKQSIADHGQWMPILRGSPTSGLPGEIIDGRHRRRACAQLKVEPKIVDVDGTADQLRALGLVLNVARRHMSASSRRGIVRAKLLTDPALSDRAIAATVGVSPTTVGAVRRELENAGEVSKLDSRTGRDGAQRPARSERTPQPPPEHRTIRVLVPTELFEQHVGDWVSCRAFRLLERRPGVHELQVQLLDPASADDEQLEQVGRYIERIAEKLKRDRVDVETELLRTASQVFGREIAATADLYIDEAQWLVSRIDVLAQEPPA
jgi:hypothetical protein